MPDRSRCCGVVGCFGASDDPNELRGCQKFKQQELYAITPIYRPRKVIIFFFIIGMIFIPIGVIILVTNRKLFRSQEYRYDNDPACNQDGCTFTIQVNKTISAPVYFYYGLDNFYQNARNYVKSRSDSQNRGINVSQSELSQCAPYEKEIPCGLIAHSFFNDTFSFNSCNTSLCNIQTLLNLSTQGIAWESDLRDLFRPGPMPPWTQEDNMRVQDPRFVNWMRVSAFKRFTKLYGIINRDLTPGYYRIVVESIYPVAAFNGQKFFLFQQVGWFGARNAFLGYAYVIVGGLCILLATLFLVRHIWNPRRPAFDDPNLIRERLAKLMEDS
uniref:ALA-interacting subunit n=1 Tax=Compsopogon caeruleus TaxID=31354 RepID=A0A7S1TGJ3_9RHOD|mmetsp:Transcript_6467/g.12956  ORF Transcript_6467/g.12956 Transcript_6467/m.12956 type:complete len:328 (+) Transcript_6467:243-1226(+)|eukprot:CAMPEP_0184679290 /NCGR_PEP_ID=MMETSP0312-20130426/2115_1 /TAXON_ID=31354 /ORGANISM="Compsopogon coeruleus, Strain SAG 36.94" /LENGTH=327 /DNA_ID=CAMNT_0027128637 /DNA_START=188 /DNA_END=1171 /DNA_ORIENTATION=+